MNEEIEWDEYVETDEFKDIDNRKNTHYPSPVFDEVFDACKSHGWRVSLVKAKESNRLTMEVRAKDGELVIRENCNTAAEKVEAIAKRLKSKMEKASLL